MGEQCGGDGPEGLVVSLTAGGNYVVAAEGKGDQRHHKAQPSSTAEGSQRGWVGERGTLVPPFTAVGSCEVFMACGEAALDLAC